MTIESVAHRRRITRFALDDRSFRLLLTAGASYLGRFGAGVAVLVTIPMARAALAPELFGVWMMLSSLLGFFAFADLGVGNGVLNRVTLAKAHGDRELLRRVIAAGYFTTIMVGAILLVAWFAWLKASGDPTVLAGHLQDDLKPQVAAALTTFVVLLALNISLSLIQKIELGAQDGHWVGFAQFAGSIGTVIAVPSVLHFGGGLTALVLSTLGMQVLVNLGNTLVWIARVPLLRGASPARMVERDMVASLLRSGSMFFILQLAAAFAFQSDSIVITQTLGQRAYGDFAVIQKLFLFVSMILNAALMGLWPAFGDAMARGDMAWARRALFRGLALAGTFALLAVAVMIASMGWITSHWLKSKAPVDLTLLVALGAWTVTDAMASVGGAFMNGANVLRAQVLFALTMAGLSFAGKLWMTPHLGAPGAVLATLVAYGLISVPGQIFIFRRMLATPKVSS